MSGSWGGLIFMGSMGGSVHDRSAVQVSTQNDSKQDDIRKGPWMTVVHLRVVFSCSAVLAVYKGFQSQFRYRL